MDRYRIHAEAKTGYANHLSRRKDLGAIQAWSHTQGDHASPFFQRVGDIPAWFFNLATYISLFLMHC